MQDTLPAPSAAAQAHSHALMHLIQAEITQKGPMPFARFMEMALYQPGLGYYRCGTQKFGEGGDFVTAPEISPLFSQCLARQCGEVITILGGGDILELGAGSGVMVADILAELEKTQQLPTHYYILELSAELAARQRTLLQKRLPHLFHRVVWLDRLPSSPLTGVIIGNEVLDAMPIHKFSIQQGIQEYCVVNAKEGFQWQIHSPLTMQLCKQVEALHCDFEEGYESEINLNLSPWLAGLSAILKHGVLLLMDYGFPAREYYHPDRHMGTVMCHYQHRAHDNPLILVGLQDITAHVDFTAVAKAAIEHGLQVEGYTTQAWFLLNCGLTENLPVNSDPKTQLKINQQIRMLTLPSEMGELFKVIALTKNYLSPLLGFSNQNQVSKL